MMYFYLKAKIQVPFSYLGREPKLIFWKTSETI